MSWPHGAQRGPFQTVQGSRHRSPTAAALKEPGQTLRAQPGLAGFDLGRGAQVRAQLVQCNERIPVRREYILPLISDGAATNDLRWQRMVCQSSFACAWAPTIKVRAFSPRLSRHMCACAALTPSVRTIPCTSFSTDTAPSNFHPETTAKHL